MPDINVTDLRGGQNVTDPPSALAQNQVVLAENIEWFRSTLGERRAGFGTVDLTGSQLDLNNSICHISQWFPTNDPLRAELVSASTNGSSSIRFARRNVSWVWSVLTPNDPAVVWPGMFLLATLPLNAKLFIAYRNIPNVDRLHVWDGTNWRRTGLTQPPAAPTGNNSGGGGTFAGTRYYRMRYTVQSGTTVLRRSEPSLTLTAVPSSTFGTYDIFRPALINEGETHWELEASTDNANFYRVANPVVGTAGVTDSTSYSQGYATLGVLSEPIGYYLTQPCARFLAIEGDRLIFAGHWTDTDSQSQVGWSPVKNDPGVGNDERFPLNSLFNNRVSLDNYHNGPITGITNGVNGSFFVFKWSAIYRASRTGNLQRAYEFTRISGKRGAIPGSIVEGFDQLGNPAVYFLDPKVGPCRIGEAGIQPIFGQARNWARVNLLASQLICCGLYYPYKQQVWWTVAVDGASGPTFGLRLHVAYSQSVQGGLQGCWATFTDALAHATCMAVVTEASLSSGGPAAADRPYVGTSDRSNVALLGRGDVGGTDAGTAYVARLRTRPFAAGSLLNQWGVLVGALSAFPNTPASLTVRLVRDLGLEAVAVTTDLHPALDEAEVVKVFDDLNLAEATHVQVEFADA